MSDTSETLLNALEARERRLLAWGVVDSAFTRIEVEDIASGNVVPHTPDEQIQQLLDARLLFEGRRQNQTLYRTRSAEMVRLTSRLKQWLPNNDWRTAPNLVADFRFTSQSRRFPSRNVKSADLMGALRQQMSVDSDIESRLAALVDGRDLAQFQVEATIRIATDLISPRSRGAVICAGTGSGKTLCFYLPVLATMGVLRKNEEWTRVLALYPRNELLKDQFTNALGWTHRLNRLQQTGERPLRVGAFFGDTPWDHESVTNSNSKFRRQQWRLNDNGYVCPYARCPECDSELVWPDQDRKHKKETLRCTRSQCGFDLGIGEVALTRMGIQQAPPDVLFTTTETLNQHISNSFTRRIFGVGASHPPRTVLLDELHTYDGVHGAHVAGLLRRWRHAVGKHNPIQFTGLSATLLNAPECLSTMTGLPLNDVEHIEPLPEHCFSRSAHYQLALRGDPVSATALLSTTIQTSMLLGRMLDPFVSPPSQGVQGNKLFVFTDDLDIAHRLYANMKSAEGIPTRPWKRPERPLASFRASSASNAIERASVGQNWSACEKIGHDLSIPLVVDLTSSRNRGVDPKAQVVIATATLEVGFDDDRVGAVLQHKAPRGAANFIQRIGRAGRSQKMRPWSVVVLSDYGRDRIAYQQYESLFDPQLPAKSLPIQNRYVQRIQAVYAFIDWIGRVVTKQGKWGSAWSGLARPRDDGKSAEHHQTAMTTLIDEVLRGLNGRRADLQRYIRQAMQLDEEAIQVLMWEEPRSLMFSVLPTIHRRLTNNWRKMGTPGNERAEEEYDVSHPLPEFIPAKLFGDLNLPEVAVQTPSSTDPERMPIVQAMRSFAPGKVSRRFVVDIKAPSQWVPLPSLAGGEVDMAVGKFCDRSELLGVAQAREADNLIDYELWRPWAIELESVPTNIQPQSNANLVWRSQLTPVSRNAFWTTPKGSGWSTIIPNVRLCTHRDGTQALIRRFAIGAAATTRKAKQEDEISTKLRFVSEDGKPAGIGFEFEADAVIFEVRTVKGLAEHWLARQDEAGRSMRSAYFKSRLMSDEALDQHANFFMRERLVEVFLSAITAWAASKHAKGTALTLELATAQVRDKGITKVCERVLKSIFRAISVGDDDDSLGGKNDPRLLKRLRALIANETVQTSLFRHAYVLWTDPAGDDLDHFKDWLERRYIATIGQSLVAACRSMCPQTEAGDLVLDVDPGVRAFGGEPIPDGVREIWLSEDLPGGTGVIEQFAREYAQDPRRLFSLLDAAIMPGEFEIVDAQLNRVIDTATRDTDLREAFNHYREVVGYEPLANAADKLLKLLSARGIRITRAVRSALFARILRPGTSTETDEMLSELVALRDRLENSLKIEIDARVFAYVAGQQDSVRRRLEGAVGGIIPEDPSWYSQQIYSLLWPRGSSLRANALDSYQPFSPIEEADRYMLEDLGDATRVVSIMDTHWREQVREALEHDGLVRLTALQEASTKLRSAILDLAANPLDVGFMALHPRPTRMSLDGTTISVTLNLREVV